jgi:hypothetical protein
VTGQSYHVEVTRTGGQTGITRSGSADSDDLPAGDAKAMLDLIERIDFRGLPRLPPPSVQPDRFQYDVTLVGGGRSTHLQLDEGQMTPELLALVKLILDATRKRRQSGP